MSALRVSPAFRSSTKRAAPAWKIAAAAAVAVGSGVYLYNERRQARYGNNGLNNGPQSSGKAALGSSLMAGAIIHKAGVPKEGTYEAYQSVYNDIAEKMRNEDDADGGAGRYGLLCRLAWHASGTWLKEDNSGGSFGGTMIYPEEYNDPANAGLEYGRAFLLSIKEKHPWISFGDLWTLGGVTAVQEAGGPKIKWRPGRVDEGEQWVPKNGRLPDAAQGAEHIRNVFGRLNFTDRETVALIGAHCLGKCHTDRSGFDGPWGPSFNMFTNDFFVRLLQGWHVRKWDGPKQYEDDESKSYMMLPTDYALKEDSNFLKYVKMYAEDQDLFFKDFAAAYSALLERGVLYPRFGSAMVFKTLDEQDE